jgi:hypothetical protein
VSESQLRVELNVFSGRPNPSWVMEPGEAAELLERLRRLLPGSGAAPPGLGYRGFTVYRVEHGQPTPWLEVGPGGVRTFEAGRQAFYRDTGDIEEWLRDQAAGRGFAALRARARPEEDT